jgi:hypothetical protein
LAQLNLKRAKCSRPFGQWQDEDYDVLADGKCVGRILERDTSGPPDLRWLWSITSIWPARKGVTNGTAATREEAIAKFRAAWEQAKAAARQRTPLQDRFKRGEVRPPTSPRSISQSGSVCPTI